MRAGNAKSIVTLLQEVPSGIASGGGLGTAQLTLNISQ